MLLLLLLLFLLLLAIPYVGVAGCCCYCSRRERACGWEPLPPSGALLKWSVGDSFKTL
jgi:hypothetical protein